MKNTLNTQDLKSIINLFKSASKDEIRYMLSGVNMRANERREIILESCDGHRLAQINIGVVDGLSEFLENKNMSFFKEDIDAIKFFLKQIGIKRNQDRDLKIESVTMANPSQKLHLKIDGMPYDLKIGMANDTYPKTDILMNPTENSLDENICKIAFNAEYLKDLFDSLNSKTENNMIVIQFDKTNKVSPIKVSVGENKGVLMPMRF